MVVLSEDYFTIADNLSKEINDEIYVRTAVNRLYYGILHFIEEKYKMVLPNVGTHKILKNFSKSFSYKEKLDKLEQERVNSDYFHHRSICLDSAKGWKDDIIKEISQELDPGSPSALEVLYNELKKD